MVKLKLAIGAGHGKNTSGKRVPASMGVGNISEWELNDKITTKVINMLKDYEDVEVLRLDDPTGKKDVGLKERTDKANKFKADLLISNHHNAGISGGTGGGLVVYRYPNSTKFTKTMQKDLYDCLLNRTGLKGNRASPLAEANFHMLRESKMAAVLIEHGFMDSKTDIKVIMKDEFSTQAARGIVDFLEKQYKIKKKPKPAPKPAGKGFYRVVVGSYREKENAERRVKELEKAGFESFIAYYDQD